MGDGAVVCGGGARGDGVGLCGGGEVGAHFCLVSLLLRFVGDCEGGCFYGGGVVVEVSIYVWGVVVDDFEVTDGASVDDEVEAV